VATLVSLRPPTDFRPPIEKAPSPTDEELRKLWDDRERGRRERRRAQGWREAQELTRRDGTNAVVPAPGLDQLPLCFGEPGVIGDHARSALRPEPQRGRVAAVGIDTWSPSWLAEEGSALQRSLLALATRRAGMASVLPEPVHGHRVGWFSRWGLAFAEGHPELGSLGSAASLPDSLNGLEASLCDVGIPVGPSCRNGLRRLDVAADVITGSAATGLELLNGAAMLSPAGGKIVSYRSARSRVFCSRPCRGERSVASTTRASNQERPSAVTSSGRKRRCVSRRQRDGMSRK
jgi:hypothetical protein